MKIQLLFPIVLLVGVNSQAYTLEEFINTQRMHTQNNLTLESAVVLAITSDPWLNASRYREDALTSESISALSLPDPKVSLMAANLPTDGFDINQEPMTQLSIGVSQKFPRGQTLELGSRKKIELAKQEPLLRQDRAARVRVIVTRLWLEVFKAQESIRLIEQDLALFEQLLDATKASYSSVVGRARQQDLVRAQLELTRIDDRLTVLQQEKDANLQRLTEWVGFLPNPILPNNLPEVSTLNPIIGNEANMALEVLYEKIHQHPSLKAVDQRINSMEIEVELARQKYKPEWGLNAQYGNRAEDSFGRERADMFSVGISFDLPIFTDNLQDKEVSAAVSRAEAIRTERQLLVRKLIAELDTAISQLNRLNERQKLYVQELLPQMAEQAEASLTAYNNDDGDFAEAVRARIAELNAKIEALEISVERFYVITQINYLLVGKADTNAQSVK
ncbi:TolC family protein [Kangiella aquimarina]|uniref:TolC family protein n=1 Tax=Kangiella aquimarina TaxID=261965 RepID=A0ABZ0X1K5_9GAMM|nr:TolC family protein [Kangiella aquimarina]WQG84466.1 TolC family protein [Kangiella aquimarina]